MFSPLLSRIPSLLHHSYLAQSFSAYAQENKENHAHAEGWQTVNVVWCGAFKSWPPSLLLPKQNGCSTHWQRVSRYSPLIHWPTFSCLFSQTFQLVGEIKEVSTCSPFSHRCLVRLALSARAQQSTKTRWGRAGKAPGESQSHLNRSVSICHQNVASATWTPCYRT